MRNYCFTFALAFLANIFFAQSLIAQHSVARQWNEVLLNAIRNDYARPTVHARNLFHSSAAMYDAWAAYDEKATPYFLARRNRDFEIPFEGLDFSGDIQEARETAISYAMYRLIRHRFVHSPGADTIRSLAINLFSSLGHDTTFVSDDYASGNPAALGNYIANQIIAFGLQDSSNEQNDYANRYYFPVNSPIAPELPGVGRFLRFPNNWQPITFEIFIDQGGNPFPGGAPDFLSPEWGKVAPFSLKGEDLTLYERFGDVYWVYHDPGDPPYIDKLNGEGLTPEYQWGFSLVSIWSSHLDPADGVMWDISPATIGNISDLPTTLQGLRDFYKETEGGDPSVGHDLNPVTGQPYAPNVVPRADYARVLAEFWADGPDSETPPGHWFTILNYVNDHPQFEKRFKGQGDILDELEWDVKAYFALGGAMHDAAITAWGIKGWYDYVRPISAIRYMASFLGQSSDLSQGNYHPAGIPLKPGFVEVVESGDELAGPEDQNVGKIKLLAWKGPDYIENPETDMAGVGWILAENWWPYQRPTFVTPPFAGYISGHSTYSRAAAEVMTLLTGDAFFPGGMGEFLAKKNEFLVFEEGPSVDVTLQWATYRDASDQTSLSRIWGGIHPPVDDIPGRIIGERLGVEAFAYAEEFFSGEVTSIQSDILQALVVYPNPSQGMLNIQTADKLTDLKVSLLDVSGRKVFSQSQQVLNGQLQLDLSSYPAGLYLLSLEAKEGRSTTKIQLH